MTSAIYRMYNEIIITALQDAKIQINKSRRKFMLEIFMLFLSIPKRINFLQLERYSDYGEQRFRRQFEEKFDFISFNKALSMPYLSNRTALALDPSFIHKSGKHTPGIGYFWSGCAGKVMRGLEILSLSVIDASSSLSFHLQAIQTPSVGCLHNHNFTLIDWYAAVIKKYKARILEITSYVVADAFFAKKGFVDKIIATGLHLVCKLRDDADLSYIYKESDKEKETKKKGRKRKYGGKVDPANLDNKHFTNVPNQRDIKAKAGIVYSKSLKRKLLVVVEEFVVKGKTTQRLLFSTDILQAPIDVMDIYHTRFQMEFGFRDAKQFTGLENSQSRSGNKLDFHFNASLTAVNIAKIIQFNDKDRRELPFSMDTYKKLFHNALLLKTFFAKFGICADLPKNKKIFNELLFFGVYAA